MNEKRFEMVTVEDPLWEYGTHLKEVLQDNLTGKQYRAISRIVGLLNEQQATIQQLQREIEEWKKENRELLDQIQEFERIPKSIREQWVE